jgi:hypothetical protein
MANIRDLKKDLNNTMGDIIEAAYIHQLANPKTDPEKTEKIVDEAIETFDELVVKINDRKVENRAEHLKAINKEIEERAKVLIEKLNKLP